MTALTDKESRIARSPRSKPNAGRKPLERRPPRNDATLTRQIEEIERTFSARWEW